MATGGLKCGLCMFAAGTELRHISHRVHGCPEPYMVQDELFKDTSYPPIEEGTHNHPMGKTEGQE